MQFLIAKYSTHDTNEWSPGLGDQNKFKCRQSQATFLIS